jgi:hypothetical protein
MVPHGRLILLIGTPIVVLAFIGAVYFQIYVSSHATREGWILTKDVAAGTQLTADNVERVKVSAQGTPFSLYTGDPIGSKQRAAHAMKASHLLAPDDLTQNPLVLIPITFGAAPQLQRGDQIDVYVSVQGRTVVVGRDLFVETPTAVWVPSANEPYWVALEANRAPMIAVRSTGAGVPAADPVGLQEAVAALSGSAGGSAPVESPPPDEGQYPSPSPTSSAYATPTPAESPSR